MKKKAFLTALFLIITMLTGCGKTENSSDVVGGEIDNLDLKNTNIIEGAPTTGKWQKVTFDFPYLTEQSADRLVQFAENYGLKIDKEDILLNYAGDDEWLDIPLSEYKEYYDKAIAEDPESSPFQCMHYISDDIYIEIQAPTGGLVELDNRKNVNSVLNADFHGTAPWRPYFGKKSEQTIDLDDESTTCVLNGKTLKVADAVKNAEKYILENDKLFPKEFGAKVQSISLFSYDSSDNQGLMMNFEYTIDGVTLAGAPSVSIDDENGNSYRCYPVMVECGMLTENTIDWIWLPAVDGATQYTSEDCEIAISREKACETVSQKLSREYKFNVDEIQLMYAAYRVESGGSRIEPMWRFYITDIKAQEYSRLYVYVSAVDGTVQMARVMS